MMGWIVAAWVGFIILAVSAPFWGPALWVRYKSWRDHDPLSPATLAADAALALLKAHPEEWSCDRYNLTHPKTGLSIWIANDDYGLTVTANRVTMTPQHPERAALAAAYKDWKRGIDGRAEIEAIRELRNRMKAYEAKAA